MKVFSQQLHVMKNLRRTNKPASSKAAPSTAPVTEMKLERVFGGALNAYLTYTGETQGTTQGSSSEEEDPC